MINGFVAAIRFITILPIGKSGAFDPKGMIPYFPLVGLLLGAILAGADYLFCMAFSKETAGLLDVVLLIFLTGALHMDGLGDAADGLWGHNSRKRALEIMKDSRVGAMGLIAIVCGILLKWCGIMNLAEHRSLWLLIIPAYARGSMIFGIRFLEYGRPEGGTGRSLFEEPLSAWVFLGLALPVLLSFFLGVKGILFNCLFLIFTGAILYYYKKRLGCITGDLLGAMTETMECVLFLFAALQLT